LKVEEDVTSELEEKSGEKQEDEEDKVFAVKGDPKLDDFLLQLTSETVSFL
jgi:hypothetical protein